MQNTQDNIKLFGNLITISGIFCLVVAGVLLVNYIHLTQAKPLETEAMKSLIQHFQADPDNEAIKKEIRNLDLLARKAFFTSNWQIRTGAFLLLMGGIAFAAFLRIYHNLKARIQEPLIEGTETGITRLFSQRGILITGGLVLGLALTASFLSTDYLKFYQETGSVVQTPVDTGIKVAEVDGGQDSRGSSSESSTLPAGENDQAAAQPEQTAAATANPEAVPSATGASNVVDASTQQAGPADGQGTAGAIPPAGKSGTAAGGDYRRNHPAFRGPWGQGESYHVRIPVDWDGPSGRNIKWKVALPKKGYNSPVLWGDLLFIAGADNDSRVVYCYNRHDGTLRWEHVAKDIPGSPAVPPRTTADTGLSAPSVATDGKVVTAIFGTGDLVALDLDGNRIWAKNLSVPDNHYGHSSSLLCWKEKVIVQFDTNKGGRLLALSTKSGDILWDMPRKSKISWSSPMIAEIDGRFQVVTTSSPTVAGYDFESGALIWSLDCLSGEVGPSAAYADGLVYAANEYATLAAIRPGTPAEIVWQADEYLPEASSPAISNGLLFIATSYGVFVCYDAKTGDKLWEKEFSQGFYGSPMIVEGKVYIMERNGIMHIFKVDRTLNALGDPALGEKSVVTPAFADGAIYLRGEKNLYCIGG